MAKRLKITRRHKALETRIQDALGEYSVKKIKGDDISALNDLLGAGRVMVDPQSGRVKILQTENSFEKELSLG